MVERVGDLKRWKPAPLAPPGFSESKQMKGLEALQRLGEEENISAL